MFGWTLQTEAMGAFVFAAASLACKVDRAAAPSPPRARGSLGLEVLPAV